MKAMIHIEKKRPRKSPVKSLYPLLDLIDKKIYPKRYYEKNREIYNGTLLPATMIEKSPLNSSVIATIPDPYPIPNSASTFAFFKDSALYLVGSVAAVILIISMIAKFRIKIF